MLSQSSFYVMCRHQDVVRTIRVSELSNDACAVLYGKNGVDEQVAKFSKKNLCHSVLKNIKKNLEKADWKCKEIGRSEVLTELKE